uniref:Replicase n=1 Tax=Coleopteran rhabdo-related virus OKIAV28 TaxID=2746288 RepID=A0A7D7JPW1_9RHAB|nr:RNA-dependent RNA polymerase [Coleopteran rhabdo-related virus OKIAV28]
MNSRCLPTHLDSPLNNSILLECLSHIANPKINFRNHQIRAGTSELKGILTLSKYKSNHSNDLFPQELIGHLTDELPNFPRVPQNQKSFKDFLWCSQTMCELQLSGYHGEFHDTTEVENLFTMLHQHELTDHLRNFYNLRCFLEEGVCLSATTRTRKWTQNPTRTEFTEGVWTLSKKEDNLTFYQGKLGDLEVTMGEKWVVIIFKRKFYLTTRDHFLLISDIFSQRFISLFSCILADLRQLQNYPSPSLLLFTYNWGDCVIDLLKNEGFDKIALWESLMIGFLLRSEEDEIVDNTSFYIKMFEEFISHPDDNVKDTLRDHLTNLFTHLPMENPHIISQLFGQYRLWGHPTIDGFSAIKKLKEIACRSRAVNHSMIKLIHLTWREIFSINYFKKNRKWPNLMIDQDAPDSYLLDCLSSGREISLIHENYVIDHWAYVTFEKTFEVPDKFELSEMISDKATSFNMEELRREVKQTGTIGAGYKRSVILKWLENAFNDPKSFLEDIDKNGFDLRERCNGVHPKERELKRLARLYGLLTIQKRLYVVITEALLADCILPLFPEITMTFSESALKTRIHQLTAELKSQKKRKTRRVTVNIDFQKWNSWMREEETKPIFQDFDNLFGFSKVFTRSHELFNPGTFYLADGSYTPQFDKLGQMMLDKGCWTNHIGGIEGLRQKGWTIWTVVILILVARTFGVRCRLIGQGDNQVMVCEYPAEMTTAETSKLHSRLIAGLELTLGIIGPPLKTEETWTSSSFFTYGKFMVFEGKPLSMSLKKLNRTMRLTNEGFQNLESTLSSIVANASAATLMDHDPIIPFIIGTFESAGAVYLHTYHTFFGTKWSSAPSRCLMKLPEDGKQKVHTFLMDPELRGWLLSRDPKYLLTIMILPSCLGGFPTLQFPDLLLHGFPDPLTLNLHNLNEMRKKSRIKFPWLLHRLAAALLPRVNNNTSENMLITNPTSLNLLKPSSGSDKIKSMVFDFLTHDLDDRYRKNPMFLEFLAIAQESQKELSQLLFRMEPLNPRVANSILTSTIVGRAMKIIAKINKTGTIIGLMLRSRDRGRKLAEIEDQDEEHYRSPSVPELFGRFEINFWYGVLYAMQKRSDDQDLYLNDMCSTLYAQKLREAGWRRPITGVTVANPFETFTWEKSDGSSCEKQNHLNPEAGYIWIRTSANLSDFPYLICPSTKLGPFKPFFGAVTETKIKYEGGLVKRGAKPLIKKALDLLALIGWGTDKGSKLAELIYQILGSFTDIDPDLLTPDANMIDGSVEHRWADEATDHKGSISVSYELATHITVVTNNLMLTQLPQAGSGDNFNVNFQAIFSMISSLWSLICVSQDHEYYSPSYHLHIKCNTCVAPIYEGMLDLPADSDLTKIECLKPRKENPYCWIDSEVLYPRSSVALEELPEGSFPLTPSSTDLSLEIIAAEWVLQSNPLTIQNQAVSYQLAETSKLLPIVSAPYINLQVLLENLISFRFISYSFVNISSLTRTPNLSLSSILMTVKQLILATPALWYTPLLPLFLNPANIESLVTTFPSLIPPLGTPPSKIERLAFIKRASELILITITPFRLTQLIQRWVGDGSGYLKTNIPSLNAQVIMAVWELFQAREETIPAKLNYLWGLRFTYLEIKGIYQLSSNSNLAMRARCLLNTLSTVCPQGFDRFQWNTDFFQTGFSHVSGMVCYKIMLDTAIKRFKTIQRDSALSQSSALPSLFDPVSTLPNAAVVICDSPLQMAKSPVVLPPTFFVPSTSSLSNHYWRSAGQINNSIFKLYSILKALPNHAIPSEGLVVSLGDGAGGNILGLARLYPNLSFVYHSLYSAESLSSTGLDAFTPSYLYLMHNLRDRVDGIRGSEERNCDLENPVEIAKLDELYPERAWVICDVEGQSWESLWRGVSISTHVIRSSWKSQAQLMILKLYANRLDLLLFDYIFVLCYYQDVAIIRSLFSSLGNTEVYLIGYRRRDMPLRLNYKYDQETDAIMLPDFGPTKASILKFNQWVTSCAFFYGTCQNVSVLYRNFFFPKKWMDQSIKRYLSIFESDASGDKAICLPTDLIRVFKKKYNLSLFTGNKLSSFKINILGFSLKEQMCFQLLLWEGVSFMRSKAANLDRFINFIASGYICFYPTLNGSWGVQLYPRYPSRKFINTHPRVVHSFERLLSESGRKKLLAEIGWVVSLNSSKKIRSITENLRFPYTFAENDSLWYQNINKKCLPPSLSPRSPAINVQGVIHQQSLVLTSPRGKEDQIIPHSKEMNATREVIVRWKRSQAISWDEHYQDLPGQAEDFELDINWDITFEDPLP